MSEYLNIGLDITGLLDNSQTHDKGPALIMCRGIEYMPVRHGHWIAVTVSSGRDSWQCSECGRHARGKIENLPYCHCGARMDGGNNE